jgi:hypothetical protein
VEALNQEMTQPERLDVMDDRRVGRRDRHAVGAELGVDPRLPATPFEFAGMADQVRHDAEGVKVVIERRTVSPHQSIELALSSMSKWWMADVMN